MFVVALLEQEFGGHFHRGGWAHPWLGLLLLVLIGVAIGAGLWVLLRTSRPVHILPSSSPTDPAMDILRARFAQGEIDDEEFASRAARLSGIVPPASSSPPGPAST
jgi:uncharacterized membrane protein